MSNKIDDVFIAFRADSTELERGFQNIERQVGKTVDFIVAKPMVAFAGLATVILGVAEKASIMAARMQEAMDVVENLVPGAIGHFKELTAAVEGAAQASGRAFEEVQAVAQVVAKEGVASVDAFTARLRLVAEAAGASGGSMDGIARGIANLQREFHIADDSIEKVVADLFAMTKGKVPMDELFDALVRATPAIHTMGLTFDDAARAMIGMFNEGAVGTVRQAGTAFTEYAALGAKGKDDVLQFRDGVHATVGTLDEFTEAAHRAAEGEKAVQQRLENEATSAMLKFGAAVLPAKTKVIEFATAILEHPVPAITLLASSLIEGRPFDAFNTLAGATKSTIEQLGYSADRSKGSIEALFRSLAGSSGKAVDLFNNPLSLGPTTAPTQTNTIPGHIETPQEGRDRVAAEKKAEEAARKLAELRQALSDAQLQAAQAVAAIESQAAAAVAGITGPFEAALAQLDGQLSQKFAELLEKTEKANADAAKVGHAAYTASVADGKSQQEAFLAAMVVIRAAFLNTHDIELQRNNLRSLQKASDDLAVAQLDAQGKHAEAAALSINLQEKENEQSVIALAQQGRLGIGYAAAIVLKLRATAAAKATADESTKEAQNAIELSKANNDLDVSRLESQGKLFDAAEKRIQLAEQEYEAQVKLNLEQGKYGTGQQAIDHAAALIGDAQKKRDLDLAQVGQQRLAQAQAFTSELTRTAAAAIDVVAAMGGIDEPFAAALKSALALGDAIHVAADAIKALGTTAGDPVKALSSITSVVGAASAAIGAISSLFGDSPEKKAQDARNQALIDAIKTLTDSFNSYKQVTVSGSTFAKISGIDPTAFRKSARDASPFGNIPIFGGENAGVEPALKQLGLTMADVAQAAKDLNIPFTGTFQDVLNVIEGLKHLQFESFAKDFGSQLSALQEHFKIFATSGTDEFQQFVSFLGDEGAGKIFDVLKGLDVSKAADAATAADRIKDLLSAFGSIPEANFGNLNPSDFFTALDTLFGLIPSFAADAPKAVATAEQLTALLDDLAVRNQRAAGNDAGADDLARAQAHNAEITKDLADGFDDVAIAQVKATEASEDQKVANDRLATAAQAAADAAAALADKAAALATAQTAEQNALRVRALVAAGDTAGAAALQRSLDEADQITRDAAAGFDDVTLAMLRTTQAAEDAAAATKEAAAELAAAQDANAKAAQDYIDAQNAATQAALDAAKAADDAAQAEKQRQQSTGDNALGALRDQFQLFNITDAVQQLTQLASVLKAGGPVFAQLLNGVDLTDPNGRATALTQLQQFALQNPQGVDNGFFSADRTRQEVLDLASAIRSADAVDVTGGGTSSSFAVDRTVTEVTADHLEGLVGSQLVELQSIEGLVTQELAEMRLIRGYLTPLGPLTPPALPGAAGGSSAGSTIYQTFITLDGSAAGVTLSDTTQASLRTLMQQIAAEIQRAAVGG